MKIFAIIIVIFSTIGIPLFAMDPLPKLGEKVGNDSEEFSHSFFAPEKISEESKSEIESKLRDYSLNTEKHKDIVSRLQCVVWLTKLQDYQAAETHATKLLEDFPDHQFRRHVFEARARSYAYQQNFNAAHDDILAALMLAHNQEAQIASIWSAKIFLVKILIALEKPEEAIKQLWNMYSEASDAEKCDQAFWLLARRMNIEFDKPKINSASLQMTNIGFNVEVAFSRALRKYDDAVKLYKLDKSSSEKKAPNFTAALKDIEQILEKKPLYFQARLLLVRIYFELDNFLAVLDDANDILHNVRDANHISHTMRERIFCDVNYYFGHYYHFRDELDLALPYLNHAVRTDSPLRSSAILLQIKSLLHLAKYHEAEQALSSLIEMGRNYCESSIAAVSERSLLKKRIIFSRAFAQRGHCRFFLWQHQQDADQNLFTQRCFSLDDVFQDFKECIDVYRDFDETCVGTIIAVWIALKTTDPGNPMVEGLQQLIPVDTLSSKVNLGKIYFRTKHYVEAEKCFLAALPMMSENDNDEIPLSLMLIYAAQKKFDKARKISERLKNPTNHKALLCLEFIEKFENRPM